MKQETLNKVIRAQVLAQLLLEQFDELEMCDDVWRNEAKKFGKLAMQSGNKMVNTLTRSIGAMETESYVACCDYVRQRVEEIELTLPE